MKFLCDVHICLKLVSHLVSLGHTSMHVNEMPRKWFTEDKEICAFADSNNYIVVSKDADFRNSFFINHTPKKLIKISLGNITNDDLISLFTANIQQINKLASLDTFLIEIDKAGLKVILK